MIFSNILTQWWQAILHLVLDCLNVMIKSRTFNFSSLNIAEDRPYKYIFFSSSDDILTILLEKKKSIFPKSLSSAVSLLL